MPEVTELGLLWDAIWKSKCLKLTYYYTFNTFGELGHQNFGLVWKYLHFPGRHVGKTLL